MQRNRFLITLLACSLAASAFAQQQPAVTKQGKLSPAVMANKPYLLWEADVARHWPVMLPAINLPAGLKDLSPGQCLRVGVIASGDGHEHLLDGIQIRFTVTFAGHAEEVPLAAAAAMKKVKPEGADFVNGALQAASVKFEVPTTASIAASAGHWCVPADAVAGKVVINATAVKGDKRTALDAVSVPVLSPEEPPAMTFVNDGEFGKWLATYHDHPQAALLGEAIDRVVVSEKSSPAIEEGLIAALKQDSATAARLGPWLAKANRKTRIVALGLIQQAGITLLQPPDLSDDDKQILAQMKPLDDPFTVSADQAQFGRLDMLWMRFAATGDREPIDALVKMLAWRDDYPAIKKLQDARARGEDSHVSGLTPELVRGIAYTAVGWSLGSFQKNDTMAADYLAAIAADAGTPQPIKDELKGLVTNPAFQQNKK